MSSTPMQGQPVAYGDGDGDEVYRNTTIEATSGTADMDLLTLQQVVKTQEPQDMPAAPRAVLQRIPEVTDDFIRNFLLRNDMRQTLECFEEEWYGRYGAGATHCTPIVPDNYLETAALLNRIEVLEQDLRQHAELTTKATKQWAQAKRDRDFHRASHNRVVQERNKLALLLKQSHRHTNEANTTLVELRQRCEGLFKAKSLLTIERDKLEQRVAQLEKRVDELLVQSEAKEQEATTNTAGREDAREPRPGAAAATLAALPSRTAIPKSRTKKQVATRAPRPTPNATAASTTATEAGEPFVWPADERPRRVEGGDLGHLLSSQADPSTWSAQTAFTAHSMPITKLAMHPRKPAVASCSDDGSWRLSALPHGELIVSGEGHRNWIAAVAMHPQGTMLATAAGDKTVKLWDFASNSCAATLSGHTEGVWEVDFQETGLLLASGALDHTARVWDVEYGRCRQTLRGHVEAVNSVRWQPYTNLLCSGSGDKTVSLWDTRMNCCAQTFYGHRNAVMGVATHESGQLIASCDAEGTVIIWDVQRMEQRSKWMCGPYALNHIVFDRTGRYLAAASDDATIKIVHLEDGSVSELKGHEDAVQCAIFDPATNGFLVSCGSDRTIRYWN